MNDPLRDALRRNALMSGVLQEGYLPSQDAALRARVRAAMDVAVRRKRLRRFLLGAGVAAALIVILAMPSRAPLPERPAAPIATAPPLLQIVTTAAAAPVFEIVQTPSRPAFEVVRTAQLIGPLDRARDEDLLAAGGVVGIVGHPGGVRKLILASPAPHRSLE